MLLDMLTYLLTRPDFPGRYMYLQLTNLYNKNTSWTQCREEMTDVGAGLLEEQSTFDCAYTHTDFLSDKTLVH
jgi:hypothetical protein